MRNKRFKRNNTESIVQISFWDRAMILSEEEVTKIKRLNLKINDYVVVFDSKWGDNTIGKIEDIKPKSTYFKGVQLYQNAILKKATWFDKLMDKLNFL